MPGAEILIVDDNPVNLKLAHLLLAAKATRCVLRRCRGALELLKVYRPRLILMTSSCGNGRPRVDASTQGRSDNP